MSTAPRPAPASVGTSSQPTSKLGVWSTPARPGLFGAPAPAKSSLPGGGEAAAPSHSIWGAGLAIPSKEPSRAAPASDVLLSDPSPLLDPAVFAVGPSSSSLTFSRVLQSAKPVDKAPVAPFSAPAASSPRTLLSTLSHHSSRFRSWLADLLIPLPACVSVCMHPYNPLAVPSYTSEQLLALHKPSALPECLVLIDGVTTRHSLSPALLDPFDPEEVRVSLLCVCVCVPRGQPARHSDSCPIWPMRFWPLCLGVLPAHPREWWVFSLACMRT